MQLGSDKCPFNKLIDAGVTGFVTDDDDKDWSVVSDKRLELVSKDFHSNSRTFLPLSTLKF